MNEPAIPFLTELRDELRRTAVAQTRAGRPRSRTRRAWRVVPALLLVCASAAAASTLLSNPTPTVLVADGLQCVAGTNNAATSSLADVAQRGQTPEQACGSALGVSASKLTACYDVRHGAVVYESDGRADQCRSLGMAPLPAGYAAATARVHRLQDALNRLYNAQDCITPQQLAARSQQVLDRMQFVGWHPRLLLATGSASQGPCGQFPGIGNSWSDAAAAVNGRDHAVSIENGTPRSISALLNQEVTRLSSASGRTCETTTSAEALAERAFAGRRLPVRFAVTQGPRGEAFGAGRQVQYEHGCTIIIGQQSAPDGHTILIWLANPHAPPLGSGHGMPTLGMYRLASRA